MYERKQPIPSAHDLDETQLDETCPNCAGDHDENQADENSDGSDSSNSEMDIDDEIENDLTFLRTTRSGRSITINKKPILIKRLGAIKRQGRSGQTRRLGQKISKRM